MGITFTANYGGIAWFQLSIDARNIHEFLRPVLLVLVLIHVLLRYFTILFKRTVFLSGCGFKLHEGLKNYQKLIASFFNRSNSLLLNLLKIFEHPKAFLHLKFWLVQKDSAQCFLYFNRFFGNFLINS